ncbi:MAG: GTPase ObgE [Bacillota bacterium]
MFVDRAKVWVKAGDGGNGIVAFHREKFVPRGGPSGGDGGHGGSVVFVVDENLRTLMDFRYRRHYRAEPGAHGQKENMRGRDGDDLEVRVPPGTVVVREDTGQQLADLVQPGQRAVIARGGRGGRGNARFATSSDRAPRRATPGETTEEFMVRLELKLLADAGLVGLPNAGKSTLLAQVSAARPKTGDYPFTTLTPNLGVVNWEGGSFVLADIPGLIEGAHGGKGLGHDFLRHIERTRVIIYVLDAAGLDGSDPVEALANLRVELNAYSPQLVNRQQVVAANKVDLSPSEDTLLRLDAECRALGLELFRVSAATGEGVSNLMRKVGMLVASVGDKNPPEASI